MNTEIQTFNFNTASLRILTDENSDPWFSGQDVCNILDTGTNHLREYLDEDEITNIRTTDIGQNGGKAPIFVSEPGLYKLIMRSRKPEAKEFKRWMTHEVLPTIRKHSAYTPQQTLDNALTGPTTPPESFSFEGNPVRTIQDEHGNPLFCAKDIATILGYANPAKAVIDHCKGFPIWKPLESAGGVQRARFITEGDMYRLIVSSKLPTAKRFESWIYDTVLPSIRKTGGYIPASEADSDEDILAKAVLIAQKTIDLKNQQIRAKDMQIKALEPKAKALDAFTDVEDKLLVRDAAKVLSNSGTPITEKQLREWMAANDWIYKANGSWHATAKHCTAGHLVMVMSTKHGTKSDGTTFAFPPTVRITRKGLALLHTRLGETRLNKTLEATTID